jgi:hypothetical protein
MDVELTSLIGLLIVIGLLFLFCGFILYALYSGTKHLQKVVKDFSKFPWVGSFVALGFSIPMAIFFLGMFDAPENKRMFIAISTAVGTMAPFFSVAMIAMVKYQHEELSGQRTVQTELAVLDQYHKHKTIFFETLEAVEKRYQNRFAISDKENLYKKIFPNNTIRNVSLTSLINDNAFLFELKSNVDSCYTNALHVSNLFDGKNTNSIRPMIYGENLISNFSAITLNQLQLIYSNSETSVGQVVLNARRTGLNIFSAEECLQEVQEVVNTLLSYSGNDPFEISAELSQINISSTFIFLFKNGSLATGKYFYLLPFTDNFFQDPVRAYWKLLSLTDKGKYLFIQNVRLLHHILTNEGAAQKFYFDGHIQLQFIMNGLQFEKDKISCEDASVVKQVTKILSTIKFTPKAA